MKKCATCKIANPESNFYKDARSKDGLYSHCKTCHKAFIRRYSQRPDLAKHRKQYIAHYMKKYRKDNKARLLEWKRKYMQREDVKAKNCARVKAYRLKHLNDPKWRKKERDASRKSYHKNKKQWAVRRAEYKKKYNSSERGHLINRLSAQRQAQKHPDRIAARKHIYDLVKWGKLVRPQFCSQCGNAGGIQAHHHRGYAEEHKTDIIWLCPDCHRKILSIQKSTN